MSFQIRKAERKKAKLKLGISGPSGAGKTFSALLLASGIADWEKIVVIDTENGSAELYDKLGPYSVIPFEPPFSPQRYVQAIHAAAKSGADVLIIDSISHEWDGKGGCLDMQAQMGGRYQDWAKVTPLHNDFVGAILQSPMHVIVTTRKKQDYALETNEKGKPAPKKVGMKEIQRDGFEYELTINFDVEINHFATASKDRTGLFAPRGSFKISEITGRELLDWTNSGAEAPSFHSSMSEASPVPITADTIITWSKAFKGWRLGDCKADPKFTEMCNWAIVKYKVPTNFAEKDMLSDATRWLKWMAEETDPPSPPIIVETEPDKIPF